MRKLVSFVDRWNDSSVVMDFLGRALEAIPLPSPEHLAKVSEGMARIAENAENADAKECHLMARALRVNAMVVRAAPVLGDAGAKLWAAALDRYAPLTAARVRRVNGLAAT